MENSRDSKNKAFTIFRSAAQEADTKRENDAVSLESEVTEHQLTVQQAEAFKQFARVLPPLFRVARANGVKARDMASENGQRDE